MEGKHIAIFCSVVILIFFTPLIIRELKEPSKKSVHEQRMELIEELKQLSRIAYENDTYKLILEVESVTDSLLVEVNNELKIK